jgi:hypothetical protein
VALGTRFVSVQRTAVNRQKVSPRGHAHTSAESLNTSPIAVVTGAINSQQEAAFNRLPQEFTFGEAQSIYGRTPNPTNQWLKKCEGVGLVQKVTRGKYRKVVASTPSQVSTPGAEPTEEVR